MLETFQKVTDQFVDSNGVPVHESAHTNSGFTEKTIEDNQTCGRNSLVGNENNKTVLDKYPESSSILTTAQLDDTVRYALTGSSFTQTTNEINNSIKGNYVESNSAETTDHINKVDNYTDSGSEQSNVQSGIVAVSTDSQQADVVLDSMSIGNIQFINQDFNEEFIVQDGENIQLDGVSTVQVLVQASEFESVPEESSGVETTATINETDVNNTEALSTENTGEELQFIIESGDVYDNVVEKTEGSVENAVNNQAGYDTLAQS